MPKNHVFGHISALVSGLMTKISQKMRNLAAVQHVKYLSDISRYKIARSQKLIFLFLPLGNFQLGPTLSLDGQVARADIISFLGT